MGKPIVIKNVDYRYEGTKTKKVLDDVSLTIPYKKTTAIVGVSGSGKTTLLKLILGYYLPTRGDIMVGDTSLQGIRIKEWRNACGVVLQDGFIFSDTIARNIAPAEDTPDLDRITNAIEVANIREFIDDSLSMGLSTKIGSEGHGLSEGQKQRILIARAVYKDPQYIFFDEATNSLDARNEGIILNNLNRFLEGKTAVVIAHRLSTVRNADQIVVLEKGRIIEIGTHAELSRTNGTYYALVKNQLEKG